MPSHDPMSYVFIAAFAGFLIWSIVRGRRYEAFQKAAAQRAEGFRESIAESDRKFEESMALNREQLQILKDLLQEVRDLREALKK